MVNLNTLCILWLALLGAALGSFAGVVVSRLPYHRSVVTPRSHCESCGQMIPWFCNLPLISYVFLRGRCFACKAPIAARLVICEGLCAALCSALFVRFGWSYNLLVWVPLCWALLVITYLDIDHFWVPDVLTYPGITWALVTCILPGRPGLRDAALGLLPAAMLFLVATAYEALRKQEAMGLGDIKLLAMLGLATGGAQAWAMLTLAALQGAMVGALIVWTGGHQQMTPPVQTPPAPDAAQTAWVPPAQAVPFGPFLTVAALEVVLLPHIFADWHVHLSQALAAVL